PKLDQTFQYSRCFVCKEEGHLSSQCPKNENGIFVKGGGCRLCGSKQHRAQDCTAREDDLESGKVVGTGSGNQGGDDDDYYEHEFRGDINQQTRVAAKTEPPTKKPTKVVNF
ncbi:hypothetical protein BJ085DRAFT_12929, partial [Dimargaris cristalligena]